MKPVAKPHYTIIFVLAITILLQNVHAQIKPWVAPKDAASVQNPIANDASVLPDAKKLYITTCSPCHGQKGKGDGAAASALNPKPADHTSDLVQAQTDGALFWMISQGRNGMPQYKAALTDKQRWELINYIRTLAKSKK